MTAQLVPTVFAWLLTYALHSTVLLGGVWLACRLLDRRQLALQEMLWRGALLGGLVTATLQLGAGLQPWGGVFRLATVEPQTTMISISEPAPPVSETPLAPRTTIQPENGVAHDTLDRTAGSSAATQPPGRTSRGLRWPMLLVASWFALATLGVVRMVSATRRLRRLLADRKPRPEGRMVRRLAAAMGLRRRVRVSTSAAIAAPFATGVQRPEICVPDRVVTDLGPRQQESLFAHELAHIARRDPAWLLLYRLVEGLFSFQPLNRLARRRLAEVAECLSDDQAVACTGNRVELASCLVDVARWTTVDAAPVPVAALSSPSRLGRRVDRLLEDNRAPSDRPRWSVPVVAAALIVFAALIPGVTCTSSASAQSADAPAEAPPPAAEPAPATEPAPTVATVPGVPHRFDAPPVPAALAQPAHMKPAKAPKAPKSAAVPHPAPAPRGVPSERLPEPPDPPAPSPEGIEYDEERRSREIAHLAEDMALKAEELARLEAEVAASIAADLESDSHVRRMIEQVEAEARALEAEELHRREAEAARMNADLQTEERMLEIEHRAREMAERVRPSEEELRQFEEKARQLAESGRLSREKVLELAEEARKLADRMRPHREEIERMNRVERERGREVAKQARELVREQRDAEREKVRAIREQHIEERRKEFELQRQHAEERRKAIEKELDERVREEERRRRQEREHETPD